MDILPTLFESHRGEKEPWGRDATHVSPSTRSGRDAGATAEWAGRRRCGPFAPALRLLSEPDMRLEEMISDAYSLADGVAAMRRAQAPGVLKVLLHAT